LSLPKLRGHAAARDHFVRAARDGTIPQSVLLHGPAGIGKERFGIWLGQLALCQSDAGGDLPCGSCPSCRLVDRLEHPDLHWFFPLPRPESTSSEKLREKLEEARAAELASRRARPDYVPSYEKAPAHYLASILTIQQLAAVRPALGARKVFVVGDVELMVPQEGSEEAANAFLKLLEEPPAHTALVLTTSRPGALLATIRSRVLPVRLGPLGNDQISAFLIEEVEVPAPEADRIARAAQGSIGRALRLLPRGSDTGEAARTRSRGRDLLLAAISSGEVPRFATAQAQAPTGGRGEFTQELEALGSWLRDLAAVAAGAEAQVPDEEALGTLRRAVQHYSIHPLSAATAAERIEPALELARGNVNPQAIIATLLARIREDLGVPGNTEPPRTGSPKQP
jgi:DNA polymerase III subunit delta'